MSARSRIVVREIAAAGIGHRKGAGGGVIKSNIRLEGGITRGRVVALKVSCAAGEQCIRAHRYVTVAKIIISRLIAHGRIFYFVKCGVESIGTNGGVIIPSEYAGKRMVAQAGVPGCKKLISVH